MTDQRKWHPYDDDEKCPSCGGILQIASAARYLIFDGDEIKCVDCDKTGCLCVDDGGETYVVWHFVE